MTAPSDPVQTLFATIASVSPALVDYTQKRLVGELWNREGLGLRERSIVTVSILVAKSASLAYPHYLDKALDDGVTPLELSELMTHLAFYAGWPNAFGAMGVLSSIFARRSVKSDQLAQSETELLPVRDVWPQGRAPAATLDTMAAAVSPALAHFTRDLLIDELWRRPGLAPRDRALATLAVLAGLGQADVLAPYAQVARQHGLTDAQIGEAIAHVAFYGGWGLAARAADALGATHGL